MGERRAEEGAVSYGNRFVRGLGLELAYFSGYARLAESRSGGAELVASAAVFGTTAAAALGVSCVGFGFTWVQATKQTRISNAALITRCIINS